MVAKYLKFRGEEFTTRKEIIVPLVLNFIDFYLFLWYNEEMSEQKPKNLQINSKIDKYYNHLDKYVEKGVDLVNRVIRLDGDIEDGYDFSHIDAAFTILESMSRQSITIRLKSYGGSVHEALAIIGRFKQSKCQIIVEGYGAIMSAAVIILASGDKRRVSKYACVMHHEASYGLSGRHSDIKDEIEQAEREERMWAKWMAEKTNQDAAFWYNHGSRKNFYMTAEECHACGIVDEVF